MADSKSYQPHSHVAITNPFVYKDDPEDHTMKSHAPQHIQSETAVLQTPIDPFTSDPSGKNKTASPKGNASHSSYFDANFRGGADMSKSMNMSLKRIMYQGDTQKTHSVDMEENVRITLEPIVTGMDIDGDSAKSEAGVGGLTTSTMNGSVPSNDYKFEKVTSIPFPAQNGEFIPSTNDGAATTASVPTSPVNQEQLQQEQLQQQQQQQHENKDEDKDNDKDKDKDKVRPFRVEVLRILDYDNSGHLEFDLDNNDTISEVENKINASASGIWKSIGEGVEVGAHGFLTKGGLKIDEFGVFAQIPATCDRLREELYEGEGTDSEWKTIRNVCIKHVQLEILLVEAEAGIKAWFNDTREGGHDDCTVLKSWKNINQSLSAHYVAIDKFLTQHVKIVWELGDEIRMRILSGVGSSFDIALKDPMGMVALVEAVEVYERAADQYKKFHANEYQSTSGNRNRLHFTDMRARALAQLYEGFEIRGLNLFRTIHIQAADVADEKDSLNASFTAVLRGATKLVTEIGGVVKLQMAPCFHPRWQVEMLWSSCVAHVCFNKIIQQISGPDGQSLPELTVTQLLDLLTWVEYFCETIEEVFPSVASKGAKKAYFDEKPDLFADNSKEVNMEKATDYLVWVNNMLWEIHRLSTYELLNSVYDAARDTRQTNEGRLWTSLSEDVLSLAAVQLCRIRKRLTHKSEALVLAVSLFFSQLRDKQIDARDKFLQDFDSCCAAANDFQRMAEQFKDVLQELIDYCDLPQQFTNLLEQSCAELVLLYSADAVFASQKTHVHVFKPIRGAIADDLFSPKWENDSDNQQAFILARTLEDYMGDLEAFLDEFMLKKAVNALVTSSVIFYTTCLLERAEKHNNNRLIAFQDIGVAFERMSSDIGVIRDFFEGLAEGKSELTKHIEKEFEVLTTMQKLMRIAAGTTESEDNARDLIIVLHKAIKDINITKHVVGDLWHLVAPSKGRAVWELTESLEESLIAFCPPDKSSAQTNTRLNVGGLHLDETLAHFYMQTKIKRLVVAGNVEEMVSTSKSKSVLPEVMETDEQKDIKEALLELGNKMILKDPPSKMEKRNDVTYMYVGGRCEWNETISNYEWVAQDGLQEMPIETTSVAVDSTITMIEENAFINCTSLRIVVIQSNVTKICDGAFDSCTSLTLITLPSTIITLGDHVFNNCTSLTSITIPPNLRTLGRCAFQGCCSLTYISIPDITNLGFGVFQECRSLTSVTLPSTINTIGDYVFRNCSSLTSVYLPENLVTISLTAFEGCCRLATIETPSFPTTNKEVLGFDFDFGGFRKVLVEAGFSLSNPDDILFKRHNQLGQKTYYYNMNTWARTKGEDGRLPLCTAAAMALKWVDIKRVFLVNMPAVQEVDEITGLPLFILAAIGPTSDIESIYRLLIENPCAILWGGKLMWDGKSDSRILPIKKLVKPQILKKMNIFFKTLIKPQIHKLE